MHTVSLTKSYEIAAKHAGMTDEETEDIATFLAEIPKQAMNWLERADAGK
jgi:hypothetical protein